MKSLAVIAIIIAALVLISCGRSATEQSPAPASVASTPTAVAVDARALYKDNCAACHGTNRQGTANIAPPLASNSLTQLSDAQIRDVISQGRTNTAMTGFKGRLSPEQIDALIQLIRQ